MASRIGHDACNTVLPPSKMQDIPEAAWRAGTIWLKARVDEIHQVLLLGLLTFTAEVEHWLELPMGHDVAVCQLRNAAS